MKQILIMQLNIKIDELAKKYMTDKANIAISYENFQFYYYVNMGKSFEVKQLLIFQYANFILYTQFAGNLFSYGSNNRGNN